MPTIYVLSKNKKKISFFLQKIFIFYSYKNLCILHGQVFVMMPESSPVSSNYVFAYNEGVSEYDLITRKINLTTHENFFLNSYLYHKRRIPYTTAGHSPIFHSPLWAVFCFIFGRHLLSIGAFGRHVNA